MDMPWAVASRQSGASPPSEFGTYKRGKELGVGAFGRVYKCTKAEDVEVFAVKAVSLRRLRLSVNRDVEFRKLQREADILKNLPPHQNVVRMMDAFEEGGWFFLVLELVPGGDMFKVLLSRPGTPPHLRPREASYVVRQLTAGLIFLHSEGIVHRDLKLENILVSAEQKEGSHIFYEIKITDFGLSKAIGDGPCDLHTFVGTRHYIAPEVLNRVKYDYRVDLWSLGVLVFLLLDGRYPHDLPAHAQQASLDAAVSRLRPYVGEAPCAVISSLLRLDPSERIPLPELRRNAWVDHGCEKDAEELQAQRAQRIADADSGSSFGDESLFGSWPPPIAPPAPLLHALSSRLSVSLLQDSPSPLEIQTIEISDSFLEEDDPAAPSVAPVRISVPDAAPPPQTRRPPSAEEPPRQRLRSRMSIAP